MNANPPAGWYPDPHGQAELRYWDGTTWSEHTSGEAPAGAEATQLDQPQAAPAVGQAQYETHDPFAGGGPAAAGPGPGRPGGGPPKGLLIGLGALAGLGLLVGLLFLTGVIGGGGDDDSGGNDEDEITAVIEDTFENFDDPDSCENWTDDYLESVEGGAENCPEEMPLNSEQDFEITDISINGDEATAEMEIDNENEEIDLKKEDDKWLIDSEVAGICCIGGFGGTTTEDTDTGGGGASDTGVEGEVRTVVERFITAIQNEDAQEFCNVTSIKFARDRGVRGNDDQVIDRCVNEAPRMINELIIASDPEVDTITAPGGEGFQTVNVTLTDTSVLNVIGEPGEFWFVDTFR